MRIERALASVNEALAHVAIRSHIIVVNNASTNQTAEIARDFGAIVVDEPRKGIGSARQAGLEATQPSSSNILTTDADCVVPPNWIKNHYQTLQDPNTVFTYGGIRFAVDQEISLEDKLLFRYFLLGRWAVRLAKRLLIPNHAPVSGANSGFKRESALAIGGYQKIPALEDYSLFQAIASHTGKIAINIGAAVWTSARRILYAGVREYLNSRVEFNKSYYLTINNTKNPNQNQVYEDYR